MKEKENNEKKFNYRVLIKVSFLIAEHPPFEE